MSETQASNQILQERRPLVNTILMVQIIISFSLFVLTAIRMLFTPLSPIIIINNIGFNIINLILAWWTRSAPNDKIEFRIITFSISFLISNLIAALTNTFSFYSFSLSIVLVTLFISMTGFLRTALKIGVSAFGILMIIAILKSLNLLDSIYIVKGITNDPFSVIVTVLIVFGCLFLLYTLNKSLIGFMDDSRQRQTESEAAQAASTASLVQIRQQAEEQERLLELVQDLETPTVPLLPGVLALPVVGHLDSRRINRLNDSLLERISVDRAHTVLLDLTGVGLIDTATANHLLQLVRSVRLLGSRCILTGVRADVAQTMVTLGIEWDDIPTSASLQNAIQALLFEQSSQKSNKHGI